MKERQRHTNLSHAASFPECLHHCKASLDLRPGPFSQHVTAVTHSQKLLETVTDSLFYKLVFSAAIGQLK